MPSVTEDSSISFDDLQGADLVVDRLYRAGSQKDVRSDPLARLLPCGNQGGFRYQRPARSAVRMVVIFSTGVDPDWPDRLDLETGSFTYYGDNKKPGSTIHETPRGGNRILRDAFEALHGGDRDAVPPFFIFTKSGTGRDVVFRGLAVPGSPGLPLTEDLVAVWRTTGGKRFQNYRAIFTVLDADTISRKWLTELASGASGVKHSPPAWQRWRKTGAVKPLLAPKTLTHRTKDQQLPGDSTGKEMARRIYEHFQARPTDFEACAASIWRMLAPQVTTMDLTRPSRDGGRDAVGLYSVGPPADRVQMEFALEAKCYAPNSSVGVKGVARLISRLRHRQFGVLVTTSYVDAQAYKEIRSDQHPVAIVAARDIVEVLNLTGRSTPAAVQEWLDGAFPAPHS